MESDGFILIRHKGGRRKKKINKGGIKPQLNTTQSAISSDEVNIDGRVGIEEINKSKETFISDDFYKTFSTLLQLSFKKAGIDKDNINSIICYGLGKFTESRSSFMQLVLLLCLQEELKLNIFIFDPLFNPLECELLELLGCDLLTANEEGKRRALTKTLFYMPHCGKGLYNNLLYSNWSPEDLQNVIVIGNSFSLMAESVCSNRKLKLIYNYLVSAERIVSEYKVTNSFQSVDVFNDMSIHTFCSESLQCAPKAIWNNKVVPVYDSTDMEVITLEMQEKLSLHLPGRKE